MSVLGSEGGNIFVGPVAVTEDTDGQWADEVIDEPRRFGEFYSPEWVRRFTAGFTDLEVSFPWDPDNTKQDARITEQFARLLAELRSLT